MTVHLHPHARERLIERGATEDEIIATVSHGGTFPAKLGRTVFGATSRLARSGADSIMRTSR